MRVLLFTGKGGVGKTTTAAATAVHAARAGTKTLVMSTDAAHSLGDALGVDLTPPRGGEQPVREVEPGLYALQVSASSSARTSWQQVRAYVHSLLGALGIDPVVGEELTSLPGADEVVALLELRAQVESGPWDLVVVDCAPTAETLRLLALPEALDVAPGAAHACPARPPAWPAPRRRCGHRPAPAGRCRAGGPAALARLPARGAAAAEGGLHLGAAGPHPRARRAGRGAPDPHVAGPARVHGGPGRRQPGVPRRRDRCRPSSRAGHRRARPLALGLEPCPEAGAGGGPGVVRLPAGGPRAVPRPRADRRGRPGRAPPCLHR